MNKRFLLVPPTEIGARFRKMNLSDESAVGGEDMHPVKVFRGPPGSGPNVAVHIAANAIGSARRHVTNMRPFVSLTAGGTDVEALSS